MFYLTGAGIAAAFLFCSYCVGKEVRAYGRIRRLRRADEAISKPLKDPSATKEGATLGTGAVGISLYEMYAATEDHGEALEALSYRYNTRLAEVDDPLEWTNYLMGKVAGGESSTGGVVNGIVGQMGEEEAIEHLNSLPELQEQGIKAVLYENRSNPDNDIHFIDESGVTVDPDLSGISAAGISSKSYSDADSFMEEVRDSDATSYIVNEEVHRQLLNDPEKIRELESQGVDKVINGQWSHQDLTDAAEDTFDGFEEAANVSEDIPLVAAGFFGVRTINNTSKWYKGRITAHELGVDAAVDGMRAASAGAGAVGVGKLGAAAGTMVFPGAGTVIGGGLGAIVGAIGTGFAFNAIKNWWKYSELKTALSNLADQYRAALLLGTSPYRQKRIKLLRRKHFNGRGVDAAIREEETLLSSYERELDVYAPSSEYKEPTPMGALVRRHMSKLSEHTRASRQACNDFFRKLWQLCMDASDGDEDRAKLTFASVLADQDEIFPAPHKQSPMRKYQKEFKKYPNHPYHLKNEEGKIPAEKVTAALCGDSFRPQSVDPTPGFEGRYTVEVTLGAGVLAYLCYLMFQFLG